MSTLRRLRRRARRIAGGVRRRWHLRTLRGSDVSCTVCGGSFRRFLPHRGRENARCPACGSLERHRFLWAYLESTSDLAATGAVLHFAPEPQISDALRQVVTGPHVRADLKPLFDVCLDITGLPLRGRAFDLVVCCHVLEHIPDDRAALAELARVTSEGGRALIQVPMTRDGGPTDEDPSLPPDERTRRFGQDDHVRRYGLDLAVRLTAAGFTVTVVSAGDFLGEKATRYSVQPDQLIFVCSSG